VTQEQQALVQALRQRLSAGVPVPPPAPESEFEEARRLYGQAARPGQERRGLFRRGAASAWRPVTEIVDPRDGAPIGE
jgi:hypothetical protein